LTNWTRYYDAVDDTPRDTLHAALDRFAGSGVAVDLGCGSGRDTIELLRHGWRVVAIDSEPEGIRRLRAAIGDDERLETQLTPFEDAMLPPCDLVNASFSLPFCPPERFGALWTRIGDALRPDGRFCGQLFGDRDGWAPDPGITFITRAQVDNLLSAYDVERLDEIEEDSTTALGEAKHWHLFHVVARRR
jgi:SAM-dependent methyltransferase